VLRTARAWDPSDVEPERFERCRHRAIRAKIAALRSTLPRL
jgi:hypothetical protein